MTNDQITGYLIDPSNWLPTTEVAKHFPQFTASQLKHLLWKRDEHVGLERCYRQIGKRGYINLPMFGLWMGGVLPEQQEVNQH